jgi:hypothetical protein
VLPVCCRCPQVEKKNTDNSKQTTKGKPKANQRQTPGQTPGKPKELTAGPIESDKQSVVFRAILISYQQVS